MAAVYKNVLKFEFLNKCNNGYLICIPVTFQGIDKVLCK